MKEKNELLIYPYIAQIDRETTLTVLSGDPAKTFTDKMYDIFICPMTHYRRADAATPDFRIAPEHGRLVFTYSFEHECEYKIRIFPHDITDKKLMREVAVYALKPDFFALRPLKGDFHIHSSRSDGKESPAVVAAAYRAAGFDFIAITDHNRYFPSIEAEAAYASTGCALTFLRGEEVHTPGSTLHIVHVGGKSSVAEIYVKNREEYEAAVRTETENFDEEDKYKPFFGRAKWAVDNIHKAGGIAIFPHPFWVNDVYNISEPLTRKIFEHELFDAYEIVGVMGNSGNNLSTALFDDLRAAGFRMPIVGDSDAHTIREGRFGRLFTVVYAAENTPDSILDAVRSGHAVAVEYIGGENQDDYKVYGSFRMVAYTRFLIDNYFALRADELAYEGYLMKMYLIEPDAYREPLVSVSSRADEIYARAVGKTAPPKSGMLMEMFASEWEKVWTDYGVKKRGSLIE